MKKTLKRWFGAVAYRLKPGRAEGKRVVDIPAFHNLGRGDIAIDCGANLGVITQILAKGGAEVRVAVIDLVAFIEKLGRPLKLLIDRGVMDGIEAVFVETHAHSIPSLQPVDRALRKRIADLGLGGKIDLNWL